MEKIGETDIILKPSKIEGIGVFANVNIKKGSKLYWPKKTRKIIKKDAKKNKILFDLCERFCIERKEYYTCPLDFTKMSIIWYLNHSNKPNLTTGKDGWVANKEIKRGKELTINYEDLDKEISNSIYLKQ